MPRLKKSASVRLNDSINVPVNRSLKRRVIELAKQDPEGASLTKFTRRLIEEGVERHEQAATSATELATAGG
jgi:hypothetical protein